MHGNGLRNGSAWGAGTRTSWDMNLTIGIPFARWGASPFVCAPLIFPERAAGQVAQSKKKRRVIAGQRTHPYHLAQSWHEQMEGDRTLNKAAIAAREGISRARVSQIMDLLNLPQEIQDALKSPPACPQAHWFPERQLRRLLGCGDEPHQMRIWKEWVASRKRIPPPLDEPSSL